MGGDPGEDRGRLQTMVEVGQGGQPATARASREAPDKTPVCLCSRSESANDGDFLLGCCFHSGNHHILSLITESGSPVQLKLTAKPESANINNLNSLHLLWIPCKKKIVNNNVPLLQCQCSHCKQNFPL